MLSLNIFVAIILIFLSCIQTEPSFFKSILNHDRLSLDTILKQLSWSLLIFVILFSISVLVLLDAENGMDFTLIGREINKPDLRQNFNDFFLKNVLKTVFFGRSSRFGQTPVFSTKPKGNLSLLRSVFELGWIRTLWNYQKGF